MQEHAENIHRSEARPPDSMFGQLLSGYRFSVCQDRQSAAHALEVRRQVYVETSGYKLPVPDEYDARSWYLLAEDVWADKPVGSMRITPRMAGSLEAEEYFSLPERLATPGAVEITRFAILPEYRKGKTFLPTVSVGLFKLAISFLRGRGVDDVVICARPERIWTYEWLQFQRSGLSARYVKLNNAEHELLCFDFRHVVQNFDGHPFQEILVGMEYPEIVLPERTPALGLAVNGAVPRRLARCA